MEINRSLPAMYSHGDVNKLARGAIRLFSIAHRVEGPLRFAKPDDFTVAEVDTNRGGEEGLCPLLYCADFLTQRVIYTMHTRENVAKVLSAPFLYPAQLKHADQILTVPFEHLDEVSPDPDLRPTFIFSTGRAGSTLLARMLSAVGRQTASEPDVFTQMAMLPPPQSGTSSKLDMKIMAACVSNLAHYCGPDVMIKLRNQCNAAPEKIVLSVPKSKTVFLLRDRKSWATSRRRAFGEQPKRIANVLAEAIIAIDRLMRIGVNPEIIWYEDLTTHAPEVLIKLLLNSPLEPPTLRERLTAAMGADSQDGTRLAQAAVASRKVEADFLDKFEQEWQAVRPKALIERLRLSRMG